MNRDYAADLQAKRNRERADLTKNRVYDWEAAGVNRIADAYGNVYTVRPNGQRICIFKPTRKELKQAARAARKAQNAAQQPTPQTL